MLNDTGILYPRGAISANRPVKVVLVYDGFTGLIRAWEFWSELMGRLRNEIEIVCSALHCSVLDSMDRHELEELEKADTHVIVIPSTPQSKLPNQLGSWLRIWTPRHKGRGGRTVAVLGQRKPDSPHAILLRNSLRQIADQLGMDFLCNADAESSAGGTSAMA